MSDPLDLDRFVRAQEADYERALAEIRSGRKRSHWMWYVFPQFAGLGLSATSQRYAINSLAEARAYLAHPILGARLIEIAEAVRLPVRWCRQPTRSFIGFFRGISTIGRTRKRSNSPVELCFPNLQPPTSNLFTRAALGERTK